MTRSAHAAIGSTEAGRALAAPVRKTPPVPTARRIPLADIAAILPVHAVRALSASAAGTPGIAFTLGPERTNGAPACVAARLAGIAIVLALVAEEIQST